MRRGLESKIWTLLFLCVPVFSVWIFIAAMTPGPDGKHWWFPDDISTYGWKTDRLFNMILWITAIAFVLTELALCFAIFRSGHTRLDEKAPFSHGNRQLEIAWTIVPALILLVIALTQMGPWREIKYANAFPKAPLHAEVMAGQFEWRMTYPGADGKMGTQDDVHDVNRLHTYKGAPTLIRLKSRDVLHSFSLPNLRIKQDAVPGMEIPVWFQATKAGEYELMCMELCGWGHYKMKGWLTVHEDKAAFDAWLAKHKSREDAWRDPEPGSWRP
jgi:cytochrome c oxidase subunit 2